MVGAGGDGRLPGRDAAAGDGAVAAGAMGGNASCGIACLPDPGRVEGRADGRRGRAVDRSSSLVRGGGTARTRACWRPARPTLPASRVRATSRRHAAWASPRAGRWRTHGSSRSTPNARRSRHSPESSRKTRRLLVDTYDTLEGVRHAAAIEPPVRAIRIDSGDLASLATQARAILDQLGRSSVKIIASGDLDEYKIARIVAAGAPVDGFGVGTELITSRDAPALAMVYKLVELEGRASSS